MNSNTIISQIDVLLAEFERARRATRYDDLSGGLSENELIAIHTRMRAAIERLAPGGSSYQREAQAPKVSHGRTVVHLAGILQALKADYAAGYLHSVESLIQADVFENFLEMADELLTKKYKDAAAVVAGSTLEEHIRKIANSASVPILDTKSKKRKFNDISIDLVKAAVFSESQRKILVGWYSIRSEAAHGNYANVIESDVTHMIQGIREFMIRIPA